MAGLKLKSTTGSGGSFVSTVIKGAVANEVVTVDLDTEVWGNVNAGTIQWTLYSPQHHPAGLTISPDTNGTGEHTYTPKVTGRYCMVLTYELTASPGVTQRATCLFEVDSPKLTDTASFPSPQERDEYENEIGWANAYQSYLSRLSINLGGMRVVTCHNSSGSTINKWNIARPVGWKRYAGALEDATLGSAALEDIALHVQNVNGTDAEVKHQPLFLALEQVLNNGVGKFLVEGNVPFDTTVTPFDVASVGDNIFCNDTGVMHTTAGTNVRKVGRVVKENTSDTLVTATQGTLYFNGFANAFGAVATPGTVTDHGVPRWDGTDGETLQNSGVLIDDSDNMTVPAGAKLLVDDIKPVGANDLDITDQADTLAIRVKDGGTVGIGGDADATEKLKVTGNTIMEGLIFDDQASPPWTGAAGFGALYFKNSSPTEAVLINSSDETQDLSIPHSQYVQVSAGADANLSSMSLGIPAADTTAKDVYRVFTSSGSPGTGEVYFVIPLPNNFKAWGSNCIQIRAYFSHADVGDVVNYEVFGTDGVSAHTGSFTGNDAGATTYYTRTITSANLSGGTFTAGAGNWVWLKIDASLANAHTVRIYGVQVEWNVIG